MVRWREMPGQRHWVLAARGTWQRSGIVGCFCFGSEGNAGEFGSAYWFKQSHGMGAGLGQGTFQGGKARLTWERDVHCTHVGACTVYLLRVLIMAAIFP
jgi:hypothetical protein